MYLQRVQFCNYMDILSCTNLNKDKGIKPALFQKKIASMFGLLIGPGPS